MFVRKAVFGLMAVWFAAFGIASGFLWFVCLTVLVLREGLSLATLALMLALSCTTCLVVAALLGGRLAAPVRGRAELDVLAENDISRPAHWVGERVPSVNRLEAARKTRFSGHGETSINDDVF